MPIASTAEGFRSAFAGAVIRSFRGGQWLPSPLYVFAQWLLVLAALWPAYLWVRAAVYGRETNPAFLLYKLMLVTCLGIWIRSAVLDAPMPADRVLLPFYPLVVAGLFAGAQEARPSTPARKWSLGRAPALALAALIAVGFVAQYQVGETRDWAADEKFNRLYRVIVSGVELSDQERSEWCQPPHPSRYFFQQVLRRRLPQIIGPSC